MKIHLPSRSGLTLIEMSVTAGLVGVLGLIIYSLLNMGTILGAKNTATNTAHQQARIAMLEIFQDLHAAVSLPQLVDTTAIHCRRRRQVLRHRQHRALPSSNGQWGHSRLLRTRQRCQGVKILSTLGCQAMHRRGLW